MYLICDVCSMRMFNVLGQYCLYCNEIVKKWRLGLQVVPRQAGGGSFKNETPIAYRAGQNMCL